MSNHPNRNWRRRMQQAADQWLSTDAGRFLSESPLSAAGVYEGLRKRLRDAYLAGYQDGKKRDRE